MKISVYMPTHRPAEVGRAYISFCTQAGDLPEMELVVVRNGPGDLPTAMSSDSRVVVVDDFENAGNVGALKKHACAFAKGELLVELDHDDELEPDAIEALACAHSGSPDKAFFYSDFVAQGATAELFSPDYGWSGYVSNTGKIAQQAPRVNARNLCEIFYAPNHVRAWSREAYNAAGGYSSDMKLADDHDLLIRTYCAGVRFQTLGGPLYTQHLSKKQTQFVRNKEIQDAQAVLQRNWTERLVAENGKRRELPCIDLGSAITPPPSGFLGLDIRHGAHIVGEVTEVLKRLNPESVFAFRAHDFLEHIPPAQIVGLMNLIHSRLAPGGWLLTRTPSTDGRGAWQDPTHVSGWNSNSFWYYTKPETQKYVPEIKTKYQMVRVENHYPTDWHRTHLITYVDADMMKVEGMRRGEVYGLNPWPESVVGIDPKTQRLVSYGESPTTTRH